jgi:DNA replication protein DnaC
MCGFWLRVFPANKVISASAPAHRYERKSLVITANQSFEDWDELFDDTVMTVAAIDRLVHHAKILQCKGESYRRKTMLKTRD